MTGGTASLQAALADRYRVERELGAGGMATVWLARDLKHDREVALKVLKPEIAQSLGAERFLREIRFAASLSHPHILPLFDSGEADGMLWYAMPNVAGATLRDRLAGGPVAVADAVRWSIEVAEALAYAHRRGVVHRDIKPENIMLHEGHAAVADFGIGKALTEGDGTTFTQMGASVGTPAYMSPEQAAGETVDGRSDLYALGCVLYELLTGEPPFTGPNVQAVIAKRFVQTPADVAALRDGVGRTVARAVQKALARQAIDRWQTGEELVAALREGDGAVAGAPGSSPAAPDGSLAVLPFENLGGERDKDYLGDGIADEIMNALATVAGLRVAARTSAFSFKGQRADVRAVGEKLGVRYVLEGSIRTAGARMRLTAQLVDSTDGYHLWSERYDRELTDIFAVQDEIAGAIAQKLAGTLIAPTASAVKASSAQVEALELMARARALLARRGVQIVEAIMCCEQAIALQPEHAPAHALLGDALRIYAQYFGPWQEVIPRAKASMERALALDPRNAEAMGALAVLRFQYEHSREPALALFDEALRLNPRLSELRVLRAGWIYNLWHGDSTRATAEVARAIADDPANVFVVAVGGLTHSYTGDPTIAKELAERAVQLDRMAFVAHYIRVWVHVQRQDWDAVGKAAAEALTLFGRQTMVLQVLPEYYMAIGAPEKAEAILAELRARAVTSPVPHFAFATALFGLGRHDEALQEAIASADARDYLFHPFGSGRWHRALSSHPRFPAYLKAIDFR